MQYWQALAEGGGTIRSFPTPEKMAKPKLLGTVGWGSTGHKKNTM